MLNVFFEGIAWGLLVCISIGPAFFTIIQTSIDRGFKAAFYISLGVLMCDAFLISICYLGLSSIVVNQKNHIFLGFIGGIILIIYGTYSYLKKPEILKRRSPKYKTPVAPKKQFMYIVKGFLLNIANPFIIIFWLTAMSWVTARAEEGKLLNYVLVFFGAMLMMIFSFDILKCFIGHRIKKYLRPRIQLWINRIVGIVLIIFGIVLMIRTVLPVRNFF